MSSPVTLIEQPDKMVMISAHKPGTDTTIAYRISKPILLDQLLRFGAVAVAEQFRAACATMDIQINVAVLQSEMYEWVRGRL